MKMTLVGLTLLASSFSYASDCTSLVGKYKCTSEEVGKYELEIKKIKKGLALIETSTISDMSIDVEHRALLNGKKWSKKEDGVKTTTKSSCEKSVLTVNYKTDYGDDEIEYAYEKYSLDSNGALLKEDNIPYDNISFEDGYDTFTDICKKH